MIGRTNAGGSGGGLNLKVVGGTTKPTNPRDNTIWINTSVAITDYVLSLTQPETGTEGLVWIKTADTGVEISVDRKGRVLLHLAAAKIYHEDSWQYVTAFLFAGNWQQFSSYLVPGGYIPVEYIQSTGTQYINADIIIPNTRYGFEVKFNTQSVVGTNGYGAIFGHRTASDNNEYHLTTYGKSVFRHANISENAEITTNKMQEASAHNCVFTTAKGKVITYAYSTLNVNIPIAIFALDQNGSIAQYSKTMLYSLKIYDDSDNLIADFVPCYREKDKVAGLWDRKRNRFFANNGRGTFLVGGDIQ